MQHNRGCLPILSHMRAREERIEKGPCCVACVAVHGTMGDAAPSPATDVRTGGQRGTGENRAAE
jgi:hypothetical protein